MTIRLRSILDPETATGAALVSLCDDLDHGCASHDTAGEDTVREKSKSNKKNKGTVNHWNGRQLALLVFFVSLGVCATTTTWMMQSSYLSNDVSSSLKDKALPRRELKEEENLAQGKPKQHKKRKRKRPSAPARGEASQESPPQEQEKVHHEIELCNFWRDTIDKCVQPSTLQQSKKEQENRINEMSRVGKKVGCYWCGKDNMRNHCETVAKDSSLAGSTPAHAKAREEHVHMLCYGQVYTPLDDAATMVQDYVLPRAKQNGCGIYVDLGAGSGAFTMPFVKAGVKIFAMDVDPPTDAEFLSLVSGRDASSSTSNFHFVQDRFRGWDQLVDLLKKAYGSDNVDEDTICMVGAPPYEVVEYEHWFRKLKKARFFAWRISRHVWKEGNKDLEESHGAGRIVKRLQAKKEKRTLNGKSTKLSALTATNDLVFWERKDIVANQDTAVYMPDDWLDMYRKVRTILNHFEVPYMFGYGFAASIYRRDFDFNDIDLMIPHSRVKNLGKTLDEMRENLDKASKEQDLEVDGRYWNAAGGNHSAVGGSAESAATRALKANTGEGYVLHLKFQPIGSSSGSSEDRDRPHIDLYVLYAGADSEDRDTWYDCPMVFETCAEGLKTWKLDNQNVDLEVPVCWPFPRQSSDFGSTEGSESTFVLDGKRERLFPKRWLTLHYGTKDWMAKRPKKHLRKDAISLPRLQAGAQSEDTPWSLPATEAVFAKPPHSVKCHRYSRWMKRKS